MDTISSYIIQFKGDTKVQLENLYSFLKLLIPEAEEQLSYKMPCLKLNNKPVVYFAGYKTHVGFYPTAKPIEHFKEQLRHYNHSKGAIQFPINQPLPKELIKAIIEFKINSL